MAIITLFIMSYGYFDYPSEDELVLIEWNVTSVYAGKYGMNIHVSYIDTSDLRKEESGFYYYDFDRTQPVKMSDLVLVDGKPISQSYPVKGEDMEPMGGGITFNISTPLDSSSLPSVSFDTNTIFYAESNGFHDLGYQHVDAYTWAKVRIVTESIEIIY